MINICFVCSGNTCRSIMAERLMKVLLKERKIKDIKVISRGLYAKGDNITTEAKNALKEYKALSSNRKSVKLGKIDKNTLYVTMTDAQKQNIKSAKVLSFKDLTGFDILDPYGQSQEVYNKTAEEIYKGLLILLKQIETWRK